MISARTARIDDNLGRGTDGSNPLPSRNESANFRSPGTHYTATDHTAPLAGAAEVMPTIAILSGSPERYRGLVPMRKTTHEAPSLLCRSPQDHMKISLDPKWLVRGRDQPMPTFRLPAERQPDVMPCIPSLPSGP